MSYRITENGYIVDVNGRFIPEDLRNRRWIEYQDWLALGNTPTPFEDLTQLKVRRRREINDEVNKLILDEFGAETLGRTFAELLDTVIIVNKRHDGGLTGGEQSRLDAAVTTWAAVADLVQRRTIAMSAIDTASTPQEVRDVVL